MGVLVAFALLVDGCATGSDAFTDGARGRALEAAAQVNGETLRDHVFAIVALRQQEDAPVSPYNERVALARTSTAKYVTDSFAAAGLSPIVETSQMSVGESQTIFVDIPGERPELVLLTAHYDAWFKAGADDNASAVAVLLEAARVLARAKLKRTIRVIAFDHEEEGFIGSLAYFQRHRGDDVRIVLNMDCVGFASNERGSQIAPAGLELRDRGNFLATIGNEPAKRDLERFVRLSGDVPDRVETLGLLPPGNAHTPGAGAFLRSDHVVFWEAGIRGLFLTDTADFRNKNYHTADDLPETLDYAFLSRVGRLAVGAVAAFAEESD